MVDTTVTKQEMTDLYKVIIQQETSNHTIFITVLLGITVVIVGATWWWNKIGANSFIKTSVKEEVENKREEVESAIEEKVNKIVKLKLKEYDDKFLFIEFEIYRSFAYTLHQEKSYTHSITYWAKAIDKAIQLNEGVLLRAIAESMVADLEGLTKKEIHALEDVRTSIKKLPSTLTVEKEQIEKLLKECENV